jgi:hypothetical protein
MSVAGDAAWYSGIYRINFVIPRLTGLGQVDGNRGMFNREFAENNMDPVSPSCIKEISLANA